MDGITELAKLFKERENKSSIGVITGTVANVSPPRVSISDRIVVSGGKLIIANSYLNAMQIGDSVIIIASSDNQKYYVIDKAVTG